MQETSMLADGYLRRVWFAAARRSARSLLRAVGAVLLAFGAVGVGLALLGWIAQV